MRWMGRVWGLPTITNEQPLCLMSIICARCTLWPRFSSSAMIDARCCAPWRLGLAVRPPLAVVGEPPSGESMQAPSVTPRRERLQSFVVSGYDHLYLGRVGAAVAGRAAAALLRGREPAAEAALAEPCRALEQLLDLERLWGGKRIVWRGKAKEEGGRERDGVRACIGCKEWWATCFLTSGGDGTVVRNRGTEFDSCTRSGGQLAESRAVEMTACLS